MAGYVLALVSWVAAYLAVLFEVVSVACGLYYAAELAEEYSRAARKIITVAIAAVVTIHVLLITEGVPYYLIATGIICHGVYYRLLAEFPTVSILSVKCLSAICECLFSKEMAGPESSGSSTAPCTQFSFQPSFALI
jgi:hypothetical protein